MGTVARGFVGAAAAVVLCVGAFVVWVHTAGVGAVAEATTGVDPWEWLLEIRAMLLAWVAEQGSAIADWVASL